MYNNNKYMRGYDSHASNFGGLSSWIRILLLYHCTIEMKLRVNENITIDSIDELRQRETKQKRNKYKKTMKLKDEVGWQGQKVYKQDL